MSVIGQYGGNISTYIGSHFSDQNFLGTARQQGDRDVGANHFGRKGEVLQGHAPGLASSERQQPGAPEGFERKRLLVHRYFQVQ